MRIHEVIEELQQAGRLNVVWGAGCSYGSPDAAQALVTELRVNCKLRIAGLAALHDALSSLDPQSRREKTSRYGINWAHIGLAELLRAGRVARLLTANFDDGIVKATTVLQMLPALYDKQYPELAESAIPGIYSLATADPITAAGLIERGAQTAPWLVIGCSGANFGLGDALRAVPRFEHGLYWVGYFDQGKPPLLGPDFFSAARGTHFIGGFDADSFLAYLVRGLAQFPPPFVLDAAGFAATCGKSASGAKPGDQLNVWQGGLSNRFYKLRDSLAVEARELAQKAASARGDEYATRIEQVIRNYELWFRWSGSSGYAGALSLAGVADKRKPREAARLLRKGLDWITAYPAGAEMAAMEARQVADAYTHLARFRTGPAADALFARAEQALTAIDPGRMGAYLLEQCGDVLCKWADQERNADAGAIFDRARRKFEEAQRLEPTNQDRLLRYCQALMHRASAMTGATALDLLAIAREALRDLMSGTTNGGVLWYYLGRVALLEGQVDTEERPNAFAEAEQCFRRGMELLPRSAATILADWGAALGTYGMARSGAEAIELYALASARFSESEAAGENSRALRKNWSSTLLRDARERGGPAELWERANEQAMKAEAIDPGSGGYNLACIAAETGDLESVIRWLRHASEYGHGMPLSHTLRDVNFQKLLDEPWFRELMDEIYGTG